MLHLAHVDGDSVVQLTEVSTGTYELTLHIKGQGIIRQEKTTQLSLAMYLYLSCIANEIACYGETEAANHQIENMVVPPKPGEWL